MHKRLGVKFSQGSPGPHTDDIKARPSSRDCQSLIRALSLSRPAWGLVRRGKICGQVTGVHRQACNIESDHGDVLSLVLPHVGNGPLSIVVLGQPSQFARLRSGMPVSLKGRRLALGNAAVVGFDGAKIWEPCPDWEDLRSRVDVIRDHLPAALELAKPIATRESLLQLVAGPPHRHTPPDTLTAALHVRALVATGLLREGWNTARGLLREGTVHLAGAGPGLTPAGDDFLTGVMLGAWLAHREPRAFCDILLEAAAPRTSLLSAAYLRAAAKGQCSEDWHHLLQSLSGESAPDLESAVRGVISHGATSGGDALGGFVWACTLES